MNEGPPPPRRVDVTAERLPGWVERFAARHGHPIVQPHPKGRGWELVCPDGAVALLVNRWAHPPGGHGLTEVLTHLTRDRHLGLVLVRKGAHAVGTAQGSALTDSKVDTHYVQGRTKAGGWSQQRYARRRDNQATKSHASAAAEVAHRLLPVLENLDAIVCGGDRRSVDEVFGDPRLAPLAPLRTEPVLPTREPRLVVLEEFVQQARAVPVLLNEFA